MSRIDLLRYFLPISSKLSEVEEELQRQMESDVAVVGRLASHVGSGKGKRLRPALVLLGSRLCGVESTEDVRFAVVFEMMHTATLIHDDVIDHAQTRRAKPTLNALWGNTLTVLFGDLLYLRSMSSAIAGRSFRMLEIMAEVTTRMIEGELIQNDCLFNLDTTRKDYFDIQERKTALLFSGCTETGAVLAGRPEADCEALRRYGLEIGRAFQLVDDLLDYTSTEAEMGKPVFSDLREGKLTLPMLTLLERAPQEARPIIARIWENGEKLPISPADEKALRALLERHDALAETRDLARRASEAATAALKPVAGHDGTRRLLLDIPGILLARSN
ncbi:polyprenyl synthetase family protein [Mesoterricola silvestris]|uniref:Octaprenyl diphosphate synthase n=1 Tax=Mesoterricola silvestris TaxID=2927979 RepID=A0AA48KC35_9BACT|nr:polyprenyl synthetase family protein [Mesoterricola silvestris]BDU73088.1 octaprenyl diphosphate synthase [Mesoterricola silvestris]